MSGSANQNPQHMRFDMARDRTRAAIHFVRVVLLRVVPLIASSAAARLELSKCSFVNEDLFTMPQEGLQVCSAFCAKVRLMHVCMNTHAYALSRPRAHTQRVLAPF